MPPGSGIGRTEVKAMLEVSELSLAEYKDGILPQDKQLVRRYIETCKLDQSKTENTLEWSQKVVRKGFRTQAQFQADIQAKTRADLALVEAEGMLERLEKFTGPRILTELQARIEAVRTDYPRRSRSLPPWRAAPAQDRLRTTVANCTLRAPRDGIIAYVVPQRRGQQAAEDRIDEGTPVRQGQAIFSIPDSTQMQVKARVNETKFPMIRIGQRVEAHVDAFPDDVLSGSVVGVTPMPVPVDSNSRPTSAFTW